MSRSKMYILVKSSLTPGHVALACAHASLSGYLTFVEAELEEWGNNPYSKQAVIDAGCKTSTQLWVQNSFRKVICSVSEDQFEEAKTFGVPGKDYRVMTESSLDNAEVAIVFRPREDWEPFFKGLTLFGKA